MTTRRGCFAFGQRSFFRPLARRAFLPFGVLIVDLQMPEMDGLEMLDQS